MDSMEAREARYAEAIMGGKERAALLTVRNPGEVANAYRDARAVVAVADAELAEARAEALREAANAIEPTTCAVNRTCHEADAIALRIRADRIARAATYVGM